MHGEQAMTLDMFGERRRGARQPAALGAAVLLLLGACTDATDASVDASAQLAGLAALADGTYELRVDREWMGDDPATPDAELAEKDYAPVDAGVVYAVVFSKDTARVAIGDGPLVGMRGAHTATRVEYALDVGTFAGGRFVLRETRAGVDAELTIFGSGRPVAKSERGPLLSD